MRKESVAMFHPDQISAQAEAMEAPVIISGHRACLVDGCPCKDARLVSHRRAAFFAAIARQTGETADRVIVPDADWTWTLPMTGVDA
jgi:hypothetical protein